MADRRPGCSERIYERGWPHPCSRDGVVERNGKWYCRQHDPEKVAERVRKRDAKYEADQKRWQLRCACDEARDNLVKLACEHRAMLPAPVQEAIDAYLAAVAALNAETPDAH